MTGPVPYVHSRFERRAQDHYPTIDSRCVDALLDTWPVFGEVVDCCAPQGSGIVDALNASGGFSGKAECASTADAPFKANWIVTNPPYARGIVNEIAQVIVSRVASGNISGAAMLMRANWDLARGRADLFEPPWYAGQTRLRFRPFWTNERTAQPIHSFVWLLWSKWNGEPVIRYWPKK